MERINILFAVALSLIPGIRANLRAEDGSVTAASYAFTGLTSDLSARSFSLAGAAFGRSQGLAHDVAVNPSAMSFAPSHFEAFAQYSNWMPSYCSDKRLSFGAAYAFSKLSFGLSACYTLGSEYEIFSESGLSEGYFSPSDLVLRAALSYKTGEHFSVGLNAAIASSNLSKSKAEQAFCVGAYASYSSEALGVSLGLRNLGGKVSGKYFLPSSIDAGVSYSPLKLEKHSLSLDAAAQFYFLSESKAVSLELGAEYGFSDLAFLRAGYHFGSSAAPLPSFASAGLGVKLFGVSLEACYLFASETLGGTMMLSLGYEF